MGGLGFWDCCAVAMIGTTTIPPDEDWMEGEDPTIPPAMFITVKYGYEKEIIFNTDTPCKMLMARIEKACSFQFPDLPSEFAKYDLKEEGQAAAGVAEMGMERARKTLTSRGTYIFCGFDEDGQEYELCMPEPVPEEENEDGGDA